ncbi:MAG: hypothetical protein GY898_02490 [Proteobacteria bacterium]|nr:hypothetical protein [Pseudomonadota bacterium]
MPKLRPEWLVLAGLVLIAGLGLPRLEEDGARAFALPEGHALVELNDAMDAATGGDDIIAIVTWPNAIPDAGAGLAPAVVERTAAIADALAGLPSLRRVADPFSAPLVVEDAGTLTAVTPFEPRPEPGTDAWLAASEAVLQSRFVGGQLVAEDGSLAVVVAWIDRSGVDARLAGGAAYALADADFRGTPDGLALQQLVNRARLAVALGETTDPASTVVAGKLRELATGSGPGAASAAAIVAAAHAGAADPDAAAHADIDAALAALPDVEGATTAMVSARLFEEALGAIVPRSVRKALVGMSFMLVVVVGWMRRDAVPALLAAAVPAITLAAIFGLLGLLSLPLSVPMVLVGLTGAAWAGWLAAVAASGSPAPMGSHVIVALAGVAWGVGLIDSGAGFAPNLALLLGSTVGMAVGPTLEPERSRVAAERRAWPWLPYVAALVILGGFRLVGGLPVGLDAGGLVSYSHSVGSASAALASTTGTSPAAFVVFRGEPRSAATPGALKAIRTVQDSLRVDPAVRGSTSWADFVSTLHAVVGGARPGELPTDPALVEQYLLNFGNSDHLGPLRSSDLSVATATVRLQPRGGAHLGRLAESLPADGERVALAGEAVAISLAGRRSARSILRVGGAALVLVVLMLIGLPSVTTPREFLGEALLVGAIASIALIIGAAGIAGAITPAAAAAAVMAAAFAAAGRALPLMAVAAGSAVLLGLFPAGPLGSTQIAAFAAAVAAAAVVTTILRALEP